MNDKLKLIQNIFSQVETEDAPRDEKSPLLQHGKYYGGMYNGKKFMYSSHLIEKMPIDKLERFIKQQIGYA